MTFDDACEDNGQIKIQLSDDGKSSDDESVSLRSDQCSCLQLPDLKTLK